MKVGPVPVLLYHSVSSAGGDRYATHPARFAEHVEAVLSSGRTPLTVTELADGLLGRTTLPARPVLITFDDGYDDTLAAVELLRSHQLRATVYVTTGAVDQGRGIRSSQLAELDHHPESVELGAHTMSHPRLDELPAALAEAEIVGSRRRLEELLSRRVESFAYPHGAYDRRTRALVVQAGFRSAAAVKNALSHPADDPYAVARWTVTRATTAEEISTLLDGRGAPLAWRRERVRTRAFRGVRRARARSAGRLITHSQADADAAG